MSRFENKPIPFPEGVEVSLVEQERMLKAKGKLGEMTFAIPQGVKITVVDQSIAYGAVTDEERAKPGLCYRLTQNLFSGVSEGFTKQLEINGVGYRWSVSGQTLKLQVGFSNDIFCPIPEGLKVEAKDNTLSVFGIDKQAVGAFAAKVRNYRSVEPYKGKGIRYKNEVVIKKVGKAGKAAG